MARRGVSIAEAVRREPSAMRAGDGAERSVTAAIIAGRVSVGGLPPGDSSSVDETAVRAS